MLNIALDIDNSIVLAYMVITLIIGIYVGSGNKSLREYSIGDRKFSNMTLFSTIIATTISGSNMIFSTGEVFKNGIAFVFIMLGSVIAMFLKSEFMAHPFRRYIRLGCISVGDMMSLDYGKTGQVLAGLCGFFVCSGYMALQFKVLGIALGFCLDIEPTLAIIIGSMVVIIYSSFGGIRSVAITDVIQFITLMVAIPMVANAALPKVGGYSGIFYRIPFEKFTLNGLSDDVIRQYISLFILVTIPIFTTPTAYQRFLMAKETFQARDAFRNAGFFMILYIFFAALIGFLAIALHMEVDSKLAFLSIIKNNVPPVLKGITMMGMVAMVMSTADSNINNASVSLVNDVLKPLKIVDSTKNNELTYVRLAAFIVSLIGLYSALNNDSLIAILMKMSLFWAPVVAPALFLNLFEFKTTVKNLIAAAIVGVTTIYVWDYFEFSKIYIINNLIAGTITNLISLVTLDLIFNRSKNNNLHENSKELTKKIYKF